MHHVAIKSTNLTVVPLLPLTPPAPHNDPGPSTSHTNDNVDANENGEMRKRKKKKSVKKMLKQIMKDSGKKVEALNQCVGGLEKDLKAMKKLFESNV